MEAILEKTIEKQKILDKLSDVIEKRFNFLVKEISTSWENELILGSKFGFTPRELIYLFFEVQRDFNLKIPQEHILDGSFKSLAGIADSILQVYESEN
jgi:acyl carrier protein